MSWHYAQEGTIKGPVEEDEFVRLMQQGVITGETMVWREGMPSWQPRKQVVVAGTVLCSACLRSVPEQDSFLLAGKPYCGACKPQILQRIHEGQPLPISNAEETRKKYLNHEASVKSIGFLYYIGGVAVMLLGISTTMALVGGTLRSGGVAVIAFYFVLSVVQIVVGTGLRRLKSWARIPTGIIAGLGLLAVPIGTIINAYILYLICSQKGTMVFSREYREIIDQTPHIKYKTSIVVWVLLGLVLLLIVLGLAAAIFSKH